MLKILNSLTREKESLKAINNTVNFYFCGPTVYWFQHIGNMRAFYVMDTMRRAIKMNGYKINHVMNITDVGHMTSDQDSGDDKMLVASKREHKTPEEIAKFYWNKCFEDMKKLNIETPEHIVPATSVIDTIIECVQKIINNGYGYETSKGIYFDTSKFKDYGKLGRMNQEEKLSGARIEIDAEKRNPADFALWVKAPKEHIMQWDSPWGKGYPGWHIECSAIGNKYLGEHINIHGGGVEHKTVHHENEIAQNYAITGHNVVDIWFHFEHLMFNGEKMSKSLGNIYTLSNLEEKGFSGTDLRYFYLSAHYSKPQNFTFDALKGSKEAVSKLYRLAFANKFGKDDISDEEIENYKKQFTEAINDNLNTPIALAVMWNLLKTKIKSVKIYNLLLEFDKVLGLNIERNVLQLNKNQNSEIPENIIELAELRKQAKLNKNYKLSDELRNQILSLGYNIIDKANNEYVIEK